MHYLMPILKQANNKLTVALSAGVDSVAVAHYIKHRLPRIDMKCFHFNHRLRPQNDEMAANAVKFCKEFNIELIHKESDSNERSEAGLRTARYKAMAGIGYMVTGQHLDDAVENYAYNCFNGVPEYLPIPLVTPYNAFNLTVIRPFILNTKQDFIDYVENHKLQKYVVEDETNTDESIKRNWLRHSIIPAINSNGYNLSTIVKKRYYKWIKEKTE
jgi:tRNA(Ile)-lysidine synthase